ncbi:phosphodiesterase [Actinomadura fibrosa]|uniref:Phosphodiesterase n=1 Tax=Actinomadura fibrosa TaxID=111802 RepID=A0ABW2XQP7_9ACTN|nr:phosphodiesterase [Actinomadura fibrosa]
MTAQAPRTAGQEPGTRTGAPGPGDSQHGRPEKDSDPSDLVRLPFRLAARLRHARAFHPIGRSYDGTLRITRPVGADLLGEGSELPVHVRLSKATGIPGGLPDVFGIAVRIPAGEGAVDLLFASSRTVPGLRHLPLPCRSFTTGPYSTLMPYRLGDRTRMLGLFPHPERPGPASLDELDDLVAREPLEFVFAVAPLTGLWDAHGILRVHTHTAERVGAFDPEVNRLPDLRPTGPLQTVRVLAYQGSRQGRHAPSPTDPPA